MKLLRPVLLILLTSAAALGVHAAELFDTCAKLAGGSGAAWELPSGGQWYDILENSYTVDTASDLIINGEIRLKDGSTPDTTMVLRIKVEGQSGTTIYTQPNIRRKVPDHLPVSIDVQWPVPDLPADEYTFTLQARSLGGATDKVYMQLVWLAPHLVHAAESTFVDNSGLTTSHAVGANWTTLKSLLVDVPSDRMVQVGAGLRLRSGTVGEKIEYRVLDGSKTVGLWFGSLPAIQPDNVRLTRYHPNPAAGLRSILLQARLPNVTGSATASVTQVYFFAQTMPKYDVLEAVDASVGSFPNDGQFHTVLETPYQTISPSSLGDQVGPNLHRSYLGGYGMFGMPPDANPKSVHWRLKRVQRINGVETVNGFEAGSHVDHTSNRITLHSDLAGGCGNCGWRTDGEYKMQLWARGQCPNTPGTINIARADIQLLVIPSNYFFPDNQCSGLSFAECCNLPGSGCQWSCEIGNIPLLTSGVPNTCP